MSAESVRDVLAPRDECIDVMAEGVFASEVLGLREDLVDERPVREIVGVALDALRAHPVELLALLAEPKVEREAACVERWPECHDGDYDPRCCRFPKSCSCTSVVAVDVLDLLVQAGLVEEVGHMKAHPLEILPTRPVFAAKDGTP